MSTSQRTSDSFDEDTRNGDLTKSVEPPSDASSADERTPIQEFLASLHLQPGEEVPEWFVQCPWCSGRTCEACDGTGRIHPQRAAYIENSLPYAHFDYAEFVGLLERGGVELPRVNRAIGTLGPIMAEFLAEWQEEDPGLSTVLEEIRDSRLRSAS